MRPRRGGAAQLISGASPESLFAISGVAQYTGAVIAVSIFDEVRPATVAWLRVVFAAVAVVSVSWRGQRPWTRKEVATAAVFGVNTALMNLCFYLALDRLPLGKSVVIEFVGPISVAAFFTRTRRNAAALVLAAGGVAILSGVEIGGSTLGLVFIFAAAALWAAYLVLGRRVAALDRGVAGLGVGLAIGSVSTLPFGIAGSAAVFTSARLLGLCVLVGVCSTAVGYAIDQHVMRRIPPRRFALLLAMLPVSAMVIGFVAIGQTPTGLDLIGASLVIGGVVLQDRDEVTAGDLEPN